MSHFCFNRERKKKGGKKLYIVIIWVDKEKKGKEKQKNQKVQVLMELSFYILKVMATN